MDFFTADHHFGHERIIAHCGRPFSSVSDMDEQMIGLWNSVVGEKDSVFIIGDFFWRSNTGYCAGILGRLLGHKYLIVGSHDDFLGKAALAGYFEFVKKYHVYKKGNRRAVLFHNPLYSWDGMGHGVYHLFGHVHERYLRINDNPFTYNVGVDLNGFAPISSDMIFTTPRDL